MSTFHQTNLTLLLVWITECQDKKPWPTRPIPHYVLSHHVHEICRSE